jgi:hypothetical protein
MPVILFSGKRDLIEDRGYFFLNQKVKGARNIMKPIYRSVKISGLVLMTMLFTGR